jgi:3',5'-nucleoside bisphosphate phosphatase
MIAKAGGVASLAHPGLAGRDEPIAGWIREGLPAIEVYHSEHSAADVARYARLARRFRIAKRAEGPPITVTNATAARHWAP